MHPGSGPADIEIRCVRGSEEAPPDVPWMVMEDGAAVLRFDGIRFRVRDGRTIDILAPEEIAEVDIRIWLLGTVVAALLHQRGFLPIHANVLAFANGEAAAFAGDSGTGKSTLAAWMDRRGHRVLTDDLCAVRTSDGPPAVFEGIPRMKLWRETLHAFGRTADGLGKVASDLDKYHVPLQHAPGVGSLEPVALTRIYLLDRAAEGAPFAIERLSGLAAAQGVLANAFRWEVGQLIHGDQRAQFDQCLEVARHAAVFRVRRQWRMDRMEEEAMEIERRLLAPIG